LLPLPAFDIYIPILMTFSIALIAFSYLPGPLVSYRELGILRRLSMTPVPAYLLNVGSSSGLRPGTARRRRVQIIGCTTIGSDRVPLRPGETGQAAGMVEVAVAEDHRLDLGQVAAATRLPPWTPSSRCARVR
jgi:hypothetical protein